MTRWERCLRLLWVLVFVPLLGGLGLELPRLHHDPHEAVERTTVQSMHASRRETSQASPTPAGKSCPIRKLGVLPMHLDAALLSAERRTPCAADLDGRTYWRGATLRTWHARGPPVGAA